VLADLTEGDQAGATGPDYRYIDVTYPGHRSSADWL
jgi:hypothetical protein